MAYALYVVIILLIDFIFILNIIPVVARSIRFRKLKREYFKQKKIRDGNEKFIRKYFEREEEENDEYQLMLDRIASYQKKIKEN